MEKPADIVRASSLGSRLICLAALVNSTLVGLLMVLDLEVGWDAIPLRIVAVVALLANSGLALAMGRQRRPQRFADLELLRLERAAQIAATANQAKSRYLANVSHEIRSPLNAMQHGYSRAFSTILDSNATGFLSHVMLFTFGAGPVRGFAITITVGIITSMFTATVVARLMMVKWYGRYRPQALPV